MIVWEDVTRHLLNVFQQKKIEMRQHHTFSTPYLIYLAYCTKYGKQGVRLTENWKTRYFSYKSHKKWKSCSIVKLLYLKYFVVIIYVIYIYNIYIYIHIYIYIYTLNKCFLKTIFWSNALLNGYIRVTKAVPEMKCDTEQTMKQG